MSGPAQRTNRKARYFLKPHESHSAILTFRHDEPLTIRAKARPAGMARCRVGGSFISDCTKESLKAPRGAASQPPTGGPRQTSAEPGDFRFWIHEQFDVA